MSRNFGSSCRHILGGGPLRFLAEGKVAILADRDGFSRNDVALGEALGARAEAAVPLDGLCALPAAVLLLGPRDQVGAVVAPGLSVKGLAHLAVGKASPVVAIGSGRLPLVAVEVQECQDDTGNDGLGSNW